MNSFSFFNLEKFYNLDSYKSELEDDLKQLDRQYKYVDNCNKAVHEAKLSHIMSKLFNFLKMMIKSAIKIIISLCKKVILLLINFIDFIIKKIRPFFKKGIDNTHIEFTMSDGTYVTLQKTSFNHAINLFINNTKRINSLIKNYKDSCINTIRLIEETIEKDMSNNNPVFEQIVLYYDTFQYKDDFSKISFQGSSLIDELLLENIASFDLSRLEDLSEKINESQKSITEILSFLKNDTSAQLLGFTLHRVPFYLKIEESFLTDKNIINNKFIQLFLGEFENNAREPDMFKAIRKNLIDEYFFTIPDSLTTNEEKRDFIQKNISLIISKYKAILEQYQNIIRLNFTSLYVNYLSSKKNDVLERNKNREIKVISSNQSLYIPKDNTDVLRFNELMNANLDSCVHYNGELIDLSDFNLGNIIISRSTLDRNKILKSLLDLNYSTKIFPYTMDFDISIITHGKGEMVPFIDFYNSILKNSDQYYCINELYRYEISYLKYLSNNFVSNNINIDLRKLTKNNSFSIKTSSGIKNIVNGRIPSQIVLNINISINNIITNRWKIAPIFTPLRKGPFTDMEALIYQLMLEGYKRINCLVCNPKGIIFSNKVFHTDEIFIAISTSNLYA